MKIQFNKLPKSAKKSLIQYFVIDGCDERFQSLLINIEGQVKEHEWIDLITLAEHYWTDHLYELITLNINDAIKMVWDNSSELQEDYSNFNEYHQDYINGGDIPNHTNNDWPILFSPDGFEAILDGWHRFHSYIKNQHNKIHFIILS